MFTKECRLLVHRKQLEDNYSFEYTSKGLLYVYSENDPNYTRYKLKLKPGKYVIEVWGAQGASYKDTNSNIIEKGGRGGYSKGMINLNNDTELFIFLGSTFGYNGGGKSGKGSKCPLGGNSGNGGGASDVRTIDGEWNSSESLKSRIIVAGGGGGFAGPSSCRYKEVKGYNGGPGNPMNEKDFFNEVGTFPAGFGGLGFEGSSPGKGALPFDITSNRDYQKGYNGTNGELGIGGEGGSLYDSPPSWTLSDPNQYYGPSTGGGGGGGYYGGGGGGAGAGFWGSEGGPGGGGSGYISPMLSQGKMISGNSPMPAIYGNNPMTGNEGHGACRISLFQPLVTCRQVFYLSQISFNYMFVMILIESES